MEESILLTDHFREFIEWTMRNVIQCESDVGHLWYEFYPESKAMTISGVYQYWLKNVKK